jgi:macrolide transport system ATP-binding/permease protein
MDTLLRNLRYAGRRFARSPGFTLVAIASLALGIGANTAIFSVVNAVLLRDLPLEDPEELVEIYIDTEAFAFSPFSYPFFEDLRDWTTDAFAGVAGSGLAFIQADAAQGVQMLMGEVVTGNFFELLGLRAVIGRTLLPEDDRVVGGHYVVMLGYGYWQRAYGGDPGVVGREIRLAGRSYTIIGVAPEDYTGNFRGMVPDIYAPVTMYDELMPVGEGSRLESQSSYWFFAKARLKPGVSMAAARVAVARVASRLREEGSDEWQPDNELVLVKTEDVILNPALDRFIGPAAALVMVVVGLVLLIACANLASFLLARAMDRRKEVAVRLALGATRRTLIGQLLTETVLLALLGGAAGVLLALGLLQLLSRADLPLPIPITLDLSVDAHVLLFSVAISLGAGVLFGLAPALQGTNPSLAPTLRDESAGAGGRPGRLALRNALVSAQVALSLMLLICSGLFLRSLQATRSVDPGFGHEPAAIVTFVLPATRFTEAEGRVFTQELLERARSLPGVTAAGLIDNLHLNPLTIQTIEVNVDGVEPPPDRDSHSVDIARVDPAFFDAAGVRILRGRNFADSDVPDGPAVAIISEAMANRFWPGEDAIGRTIHQTGDDPDLIVVGVASDAKVRSLAEAPRPFVYRPQSQEYAPFVSIVAKTAVEARRTELDLLALIHEIGPEVIVFESKTMEQHLAIMLLPARVAAVALAVFAALALILASIGLYGLVSYAVARRSHEVGIRMSLGADSGAVVRMLMAGGMRPVLAGVAVGLVLALLLTRSLAGLLFGIGTLDPITFVAVPLVLGGVTLLATYVPARRVSRINPVSALKAE